MRKGTRLSALGSLVFFIQIKTPLQTIRNKEIQEL